MASVDCSRSYLAGSDEVLQHICGPCKGDGETKEAKYLCEICKVYLCFECRNDHKTFKATKTHSIISAQFNEGTGSMATKGKFAILCGCDQKRAVEVYCEKHAEVICPSCETIKHRNCKTCPIKDKVTKDTKKEFEELMDKAKSLKAGIESCKQDGEANQKKLNDEKEECKKEIIAFQQEINSLLDKMEKNIFGNLDTVANQRLLSIKKQIAALTTSLQVLDTDFGIIDNANKTNDEEIMFSAKVKLSKSLSEYGELIQDIRHDMQQPKLEFNKNKQLADVLKSAVCLGRIELPEVGTIQQDHVVILDMKAKSTKGVNIKLADDGQYPSIMGCTFLTNSRILLCDWNNYSIKLLDSNMSVEKSLKLSDKPCNVAAVGENEVIVTLNSNDLQYMYTYPNLKLGKKITLPAKCYGLHVVNGEIYTAYHKNSGHDEIWRLDRAGNIMNKIVLTQSSSGKSEYLGLCLTGSNPRAYFTDWYNYRVTCVQLDGKIVYQYKDKELKRPNGIYVDSAGNSLVCGSASHNVVVITADGRKYKELLPSNDSTKPRCIDYRPEDNSLIVGCEDNSKLFVYKLGV